MRLFHREEDNPWESFSDLMTGLMIIFLFISFAFMLQAKSLAHQYFATKMEIYEDLSHEFTEEELKEWNAAIDKNSLAVTFKEPDVLFANGQWQVTPRFQQILNSFMPRYIAILSQKKYEGKLLEVRIEGHTSVEYKGETDPKMKYIRNMELSQNRARSVLVYTFSIPGMADKIDWLEKYVTANGLSSSRPAETDAQSRRVEFRVLVNSDKVVEAIND